MQASGSSAGRIFDRILAAARNEAAAEALAGATERGTLFYPRRPARLRFCLLAVALRKVKPRSQQTVYRYRTVRGLKVSSTLLQSISLTSTKSTTR
jgi:hypothetical protein